MAEQPAPTPLELIKLTAEYLAKKEVESPRLEAELLLAEALGLTRLGLYLQYDRPLDPPEVGRYREMVRRRASGEPTAYILGKKEFWSLSFAVGKGVLIPRPDTETLVQAALSLMGDSGKFLELGVGSGAVSIALLKEKEWWEGVGVDREEAPMQFTAKNAASHGVSERLSLLRGDLYGPLDPLDSFDLIITNPPYIPSGQIPSLQREVAAFEPAAALDGGEDGLDLIRRIVSGAPARLKEGGSLLIEFGMGQESEVGEIIRGEPFFTTLSFERDLGGRERVAVAGSAS